jgi:predicted MFS family arabinose efflux permease
MHGALDRYRRVLGDAPTRWLLTTVGIFLLVYVGWLIYFGAYVVEELDAGADTLSAIFLVAGAVQLVANNLAPAALERWPAGRLFQLAVVAEAAALLLIATGIGGLWIVFAAVTAINVGGAVGYIVINSLLLQASTALRGSVMALSAASASLGSLLGTTLGGATLAAFGYAAVYGLLGVVMPVAILTFALSARRPVPGVTMASVEA